MEGGGSSSGSSGGAYLEGFDVMISYSWADTETVERIEAVLLQSFTVWRDKRMMGAGAEYSGLIDTAVRRCGVMLVVGSPNYESSIASGQGCASEIKLAMERLRDGRPVLGLNIGNMAYCPHSAEGTYGAVFGRDGKNRLWHDLRSHEDFEKNLAHLADQIFRARLPYGHTPTQVVGGKPGQEVGGTQVSDLARLAAYSTAAGTPPLVLAPPLFEVAQVNLFWTTFYSPSGGTGLEGATPMGWQVVWRKVSWAGEQTPTYPGEVHKCMRVLGVPIVYEHAVALEAGEFLLSFTAATRGAPELMAPWCLGYLQLRTGGTREQTVTLGRLSDFNRASQRTLPPSPSPSKPIFGFHGSIGALVDTMGAIVCERTLLAKGGEAAGSSSSSSSSSGTGGGAAAMPADGSSAAAAQKEEAGDSPTGVVASALLPGRYKISPFKASSYMLDVNGSHSGHCAGTRVLVHPSNGGDNQKFDMKEAGEGLVTLSPACCGAKSFLGVTTSGETCVTAKEVRWRVEETLGGHTLAVAAEEGKRLQVVYGFTAIGARPALAAAQETRKQVFVFTSVPG